MPSTHEPATVLELLINADVWKGLKPDLQEIIRSATWEATFRSQTIMNKLNAEALKELREKHGVKIERTPEDILRKTLEAWDQIAKDEVRKEPVLQEGLRRRSAPMLRKWYRRGVLLSRLTRPEPTTTGPRKNDRER